MITLYSKQNCPACVQAKALLKSKDVLFKEIQIDYSETGEPGTIRREDFIAQFPGVRMLPHILDEDQVIGGFTQLKDYLNRE